LAFIIDPIRDIFKPYEDALFTPFTLLPLFVGMALILEALRSWFRGMRLFRGSDEAKKRFLEAERYSDPNNRDFNLKTATSLLESAVSLKPDNQKYRIKLEDIKAINNLGFYMIGRNIRAVSSTSGKAGIIVDGRIQQGSITDGDEVQMGDYTGIVYEVVSPMGKGFGDTGQEVTLAVEIDWKPSIRESQSKIIVMKRESES
jgi:hypothetical protein